MLIAMYVVLYTIVLEKGYQTTDTVSGTTSVKLKGSGSIGDESGPATDLLVVDAMDLVQPSMEQNAFFLVTARYMFMKPVAVLNELIYMFSCLACYRRVTTPNQTRQTNCAGNHDVPECTTENTTLCNEELYNPSSQVLLPSFLSFIISNSLFLLHFTDSLGYLQRKLLCQRTM